MITAPYNFAPLSGWIFTPPWAEKVSHDVPFREGVSGAIKLKVTAESPILVANDKKPQRGNRPQEAHFCSIGGRYAIPGTTLKGMIRNILEIAAFGKMIYADDKQLSVRDLHAGFYKAELAEDVTENTGCRPTFKPKAKAGWIEQRQADNGGIVWIVHPSEHARIEHEKIETQARTLGFPDPEKVREKQRADEKYRWWGSNSLTVCFNIDNNGGDPWPHGRDGRSLFLEYSKAVIDPAGTKVGTLVFTGQPSPNDGPRGRKHLEFVFYDSTAPSTEIELPERVRKDFLQVHSDTKEWAFWEEKLRRNEKVPVFYLENHGDISSMGLAMMYRLAYTHSIGETIQHTHPDHRNPDVVDLPEMLFGKVHPDSEKNALDLKSRVSFGACFAEENTQAPIEGHTTVLSNPKPAYFPSYIRQDQTPRLTRAYAYRTYMENDSEIRGWKRYPVRAPEHVHVPDPPQPMGRAQGQRQESIKAQTRLYPLPEQTVFEGTVRFHNLRPDELGALLWALEWGGNAALRHNVGMGKPFGYGVVKLEVNGGELRCNLNPTATIPVDNANKQAYRKLFIELMEEAYQAAQKRSPAKAWSNSPQLVQLLAMANPGHRNATRDFLRNMESPVRFNRNKKDGWVLPEYHDVGGARADELIFPRNHPHPDPDDNAADTQPLGNEAEIWLKEKIEQLQHGNTQLSWNDALTGRSLADLWSKENDKALKEKLREHIIERWRKAPGDRDVDWWERPVTRQMERAKKIYLQG